MNDKNITPRTHCLQALLAISVAAVAVSASAQGAQLADKLKLWADLGLKETYDNNVMAKSKRGKNRHWSEVARVPFTRWHSS